MKPLLMPAALLLLLAALMHSGLFVPSAALGTYAFSGAAFAGLLLSLRFHSSRTFCALLALLLAQQAMSKFSAGHLAMESRGIALISVGALLPLDFVLLSLLEKRGFALSAFAPAAIFLFVQSVAVTMLCRPETLPSVHALARHGHALASLPLGAQLCFATAAIIFLLRYMVFGKPAEGGSFWALVACFLALRFGGVGRIPQAYFAAAAFILAAAVVETSYLLAYHDELTTLPSRRAFNEALLRLQLPYSIAMVDIDHFKRCNDTYGHDTGDQVLRLVASKLARVSGGGQAYRCGGEEFAILFPGRTTADVLEHLEDLRAAVGASSLRLRGPDRRQLARGPDRRNPAARSHSEKSRKIRPISRTKSSSGISVTVSIGVASAKLENSKPEEIIQAADKALYRAKSGGRNRVEIASGSRARIRAKAAGIA
jgi:diguanylate cyclase (GGDEF)-like protein